MERRRGSSQPTENEAALDSEKTSEVHWWVPTQTRRQHSSAASSPSVVIPTTDAPDRRVAPWRSTAAKSEARLVYLRLENAGSRS